MRRKMREVKKRKKKQEVKRKAKKLCNKGHANDASFYSTNTHLGLTFTMKKL